MSASNSLVRIASVTKLFTWTAVMQHVEAGLSLMHQRSFAADPRLDGYTHGFKERTINGHRILMHDGGWEGFISGLLLDPMCDFGLFLPANATGGETTGGQLVPAFFDRFTTQIPQSSSASDIAV